MAMLIQGSDNETFRGLTRGLPSREDLSFLKGRLESAMRDAGDAGSRFYEKARESLDSFNLNSVRQRLDNLQDKLKYRWRDDVPRELRKLGEFQQAGVISQRWLMINPRLRQLRHANRAHGFRDTYLDDTYGAHGRYDEDYRTVYNGAQVRADDEETHYVTYVDRLDEHGEEELGFQTKLIHRRNCEAIDAFLDIGYHDPSDPAGGTL